MDVIFLHMIQLLILTEDNAQTITAVTAHFTRQWQL